MCQLCDARFNLRPPRPRTNNVTSQTKEKHEIKNDRKAALPVSVGVGEELEP